MEALYFEQIKTQVEANCESNPRKIRNLKYTPEVDLTDNLKAILNRYPNDLGNEESKFKRYQYMVLYAIINGGVYDHELATRFGLTLQKVEERYTKLSHYWQFLREREDYDRFRDYIYEKATAIYKVEAEKCRAFKEDTVLNQLIGIPPILFSKRKIYQANQQLSESGEMIKAEHEKVMNDQQTYDQYETAAKKLRQAAGLYRKIIRFELTRLEKHTREEKKDWFYISSVPESLEWDGMVPPNKPLYAGTVTKVEELVREYTRWRKEEYNLEIKHTRREKENARKRERYAKSNAQKKQQKRQREKDNQTAVFALYMKGTTNLREIAAQTELSYYMVRKTVDQIKTLIEQA